MSSRPLCLFVDWDGTLTTNDTLSVVAGIGYAQNAKKSRKLEPWSHFSDAYMADYAAHKESYKPKAADRKTPEQELEWLKSLVNVERSSVDRVEAAGILADVEEDDINKAAATAVENGGVALRRGWQKLFALLDCHLTILSVNWSARFIQSSLQAALSQHSGESIPSQVSLDGAFLNRQSFAASSLPAVSIQANEIRFKSSGKLDRYFEDENRGIWTAADKARIMEEFLTMTRDSTSGKEARSIYVGDSNTDLTCLLKADVGICIRGGGSEAGDLQQTLERLSIACVYIAEYQVESDASKHLWWANDFSEIFESPLLAGRNR